MILPELKVLEFYENEEVILKFSRDFKITVEESKMIFRETMKMLWLMVKHRQENLRDCECLIPGSFNIQKSMEPLDKMWHEFILFTKEYHQFCERFFGSYLHHVPCSEKEYQNFQKRKIDRKENFELLEKKELRIFVEYIQKNLGCETLEKWFFEIPYLFKKC